jgi:tetratricopeptide (TPR) repeat protein
MVRSFTLALLAACALRAETVLVLPFANHSAAANLDWIGESIAETVAGSLASQGLLVLDREDRLEGYRRASLRPGAELTRASVIKIGQSLDASIVIYGEYQQQPAAGDTKDASKGSLRIVGRAIDLNRIHQSAPFTQLGALEELPGMEVQLGWESLREIEPKTAITQDEFASLHPPVRLDAMESYARGLLSNSAEQRHRLFTQAARLDDKFSQPCFHLGQAAWEQKDHKTAATWFQRVARGDSHYFQAQFFLGLCRYYGGDATAAAQAFQLVAEAVPLNEVYNNLGAAEVRRNDLPAAIAAFRKAIEGDDADPDYHFNLGYALWRSQDFDGAVESLRAAVERDANDSEATALLGRALKQDGPHPGDPRSEGRQRVKTNFEEFAYRQLQAELRAGKD